jgi:hypothetical protein
MIPETVLVDARSFEHWLPTILGEMTAALTVGIDCETHDDGRHEGLNRYCGYDPRTRKKAPKARTVFDMRRLVMCGFSLYAEGSPRAWYVNLNHADEENRVPWELARHLLDAINPEAQKVAHNAPFELTAFRNCYGYELTNLVCSLQLCVSAYGPDEYDWERFKTAPLHGIKALVEPLIEAGKTYVEEEWTSEQTKIFTQITAKESDARHSYNGYVKELAYGYGLKQAIRSWFGHAMATYEETLGDKAHMGQLTGPEAAAYGAEDAYWAVKLARRLLDGLPMELWQTFLQQELPMVRVYADLWREGLRIDVEAIKQQRLRERKAYAAELRKLRAAVKALLPFRPKLHRQLAKRDAWYAKNGQAFRSMIEGWAELEDAYDDFDEARRVRGAVSNGWCKELGQAVSKGPNFSHYMPLRVLLYDLLRRPLISDSRGGRLGWTQSDGEARGKIKEKIGACPLIDRLNAMAGIEQRMKLYLTPYEQLVDPETHRIYPVVSSRLATRRMAAQSPNPMQLAKRGESTYVRGFFLPDRDDHLVVSIDWSAIELVLIGDMSKDPEFAKAYCQLPHQDLHGRAAAAVLGLDRPGSIPPQPLHSIRASRPAGTLGPRLEAEGGAEPGRAGRKCLR